MDSLSPFLFLTGLINDRKLSSESLNTFLSDTLDCLPQSSEDLAECFGYYLDELSALSVEAEKVKSSEISKDKHALVSEFEIDARPGLRTTKVSQKLRQEKDRESMTNVDEKYTALVEDINVHLTEIFEYAPSPSSDQPLVSPPPAPFLVS